MTLHVVAQLSCYLRFKVVVNVNAVASDRMKRCAKLLIQIGALKA